MIYSSIAHIFVKLGPSHDWVTKQKSDEISLIKAENEDNNELLASFSTKSSGISAIFTRHPSRAKVSVYKEMVLIAAFIITHQSPVLCFIRRTKHFI